MAALLTRHSVVPTFKVKSFVKRKRGLLFGISRYLFGSHEVNMPVLYINMWIYVQIVRTCSNTA